MSKRYDVIVIGGGHNGLITAAYLARAGKSVLVLERRPRVGGAAVTEEIFPGFKFSMFSYVVSLLRPEIIRDLDLPRHGLHILPLESTVTPMENGDYFAAWADHDETRRELYRHSPRDAEAYDEYGHLMHFMARAVKPILSMVPPDPTSFAPGDLIALLKLGKHFRGLGAERLHALVKLMTMSSADFLDEWFETDVLKATKSASGIIGTFLGPRSPGTAYVLLHHYMGELDGVFQGVGIRERGHGRGQRSHCIRCSRVWRRGPLRRWCGESLGKRRESHRRGARKRRRVAREYRGLQPGPPPDVPPTTRD